MKRELKEPGAKIKGLEPQSQHLEIPPKVDIGVDMFAKRERGWPVGEPIKNIILILLAVLHLASLSKRCSRIFYGI